MGPVPYTTEETARATPVAASCTYDSGSMDGCRPLCDQAATHRVLYDVPCYGWHVADVCSRHVRPTQGRIYPSNGVVIHLMERGEQLMRTYRPDRSA